MRCDTCDEKYGGDSELLGTCPECLCTILANSFPEEDDEPEVPEDEDLVTSDYTTFHRANMNRIAFIVPHGGDWQDSAREYMDRERFWPNVWVERERGGYDLLTMEGS